MWYYTNGVFLIVTGKLLHVFCLICILSFHCHFLQDLTCGQSSRHAVSTLHRHSYRYRYRYRKKPLFSNYVCISKWRFHHLLPGNFSQLLIILDDSPKEKVPAWVPLGFSIVLPEWSWGSCLTFRQLEEK